MNIQKIRDDLFRIVLPQPALEGFDDFISSWLYRGGHTLLIDIGPASSVRLLAEGLRSMGISSLDAVLLSHIHIDHAGGVGAFLDLFPGTPVVVHDEGITHLADPRKLQEGSVKTLGRVAEAYGPIGKVPREHMVAASTFSEFDVIPLPTPGHAPHHMSYRVKDLLFAGEVAGVYRSLPGGIRYLRPATPPRFFLETSLGSIEKVKGGGENLMVFAHWDVSEETEDMLSNAGAQLERWRDLIAAETDGYGKEGFIDRVTGVLLERDPLLAGFPLLSPADRSRERIFIANSIRGFAGYLRESDRA